MCKTALSRATALPPFTHPQGHSYSTPHCGRDKTCSSTHPFTGPSQSAGCSPHHVPTLAAVNLHMTSRAEAYTGVPYWRWAIGFPSSAAACNSRGRCDSPAHSVRVMAASAEPQYTPHSRWGIGKPAHTLWTSSCVIQQLRALPKVTIELTDVLTITQCGSMLWMKCNT